MINTQLPVHGEIEAAPDRPDLLLLGLHEYTKSRIGRPPLASAEKHKIIGDGLDHRGGSATRRTAL
jgi:hypothetical protein